MTRCGNFASCHLFYVIVAKYDLQFYVLKVARVLMHDSAPLSKRARREVPEPAPEPAPGGTPEPMETADPVIEVQATQGGSLSINGLLLAIFVLMTVATQLFRQVRRLTQDILALHVQCSQLRKELEALRQTTQERASAASPLPPKPERSNSKKCRVLVKGKHAKSQPNIFRDLLTAKNVKYYTGVRSIALVQLIHDFVKDFVVRRHQGQASVKRKRVFRKTPSKFGPKRFLRSIDELVLVLMRLRLGLDLQDLADRFAISVSLASKVFTSWMKALSATLCHMVQIPDVETVLATKPVRYRGRDLTNLVAIIDCTEIFIETPQDLATQAATWSDYKHHNTLKILVAVCPNSYICYVSAVYEGRISDTELTKDCGFLEQLDPHTCVMADKGFSIATECAQQSLGLIIPPGRRGQSQMSKVLVQKTKKVANLRILVEQVIRRLKCFKFLKNEMSLAAADLVDEAVIVCAALCNLQRPIYVQ